MGNYKISVSKDGKKYNLLLKAENEAIARQRVHDEGYSILTLQEVTEKEQLGNIFIFEGFNKNKQLKTGKIVGDDILKVYIKLRKDLEYDIINLYQEKEEKISSKEKEDIMNELKQEYNLYYKSGKKEKIDELREKLNREKIEKQKMGSFHLKKQLEETTKLIGHVLEKIDFITSDKSRIKIEPLKIEKLKDIRNNIIKLKKSTNINKLKEVGEKALLKIGELELQEVEKNKDKQTRNLLNNTNKLLKNLGSKEQFIEKDKDLKYQLGVYFSRIKEIFTKKEKIRVIKKDDIDKNSHFYMKNSLYLLKYKEKKRENTKYILKNFFKILTNENLRTITFLKRNVINQNIILLKAKLNGKIYSYTSVKKGFSKFLDSIFGSIKIFKTYLFLIIINYTILFLVYINVNSIFINTNSAYELSYNYDGLYLFLIFFSFYILLYLSRNFCLLIFNFVIFIFIVIFGVVNF